MSFSLPKIKLGVDVKKKNKFDLTHDCNTTSDWGFVQPISVTEVPADSTVKIGVDQFVRNSAMVKPTFGRISCRTYHSFVPIEDLYPAFPNLLSGKPYNGNSSYIPTYVPSIQLNHLKRILYSFGTWTVWLCDSDQVSSDGSEIQFGAVTPLTSGDDEWVDDNLTFLKQYGYINSVQKNYLNYNKIIYSYYTGYDGFSTIGSCDFFTCYHEEVYDKYYLLTFKLSKLGRNLRKILIGCGYQLNNSSTYVSLLPLFAYYKAWFDLFYPQRDVTWTETNAFQFLNKYVFQNYNISNVIVSSGEFYKFWYDLACCYYTGDPDFFSAHITGAAVAEDNTSLPYSTYAGGQDAVATPSATSQPYLTTPASTYISWTALNALKLLTRFVNKNTVIGGKIDNYLRVHYGSDYLNDNESNFIGSNSFSVTIGDVMATANTSGSDGSVLGEYAGRGVGYSGDTKMFSFNAKVPGYVISMTCVVPLSNYCQGVNPNLTHRGRFDFFTPAFDALGFQSTYSHAFYGVEECGTDTIAGSSQGTQDTAFGNIPRYTEYKTTQNIANGDITLRSTRANLLPFTLDRMLPYGEFDDVGDTQGSQDANYMIPLNNNYVAGSWLRYIGLYPWIGNFNRVFYNEGDEDYGDETTMFVGDTFNPTDDNFILHNTIKFDLIAPMLSVSESFDTDAFDGKTVDVNKQ